MLSKFTTDVIGNVIFGLELNTMNDPKSKFRAMGKKVFESSYTLIVKFLFGTTFSNLARILRVRIFDVEMTDFFTMIIKENVEYRLENKINKNDFMDLLLKLYVNGKLTLNEMTANSFLFFLAGFETSSSTSTFVLYNLATNPDIQETLREEIKSNVEKNDGKITYESVMQMKYLQMVVDGKFNYSKLLKSSLINFHRNSKTAWTGCNSLETSFKRLSSS